jgi:hypothetical protein
MTRRAFREMRATAWRVPSCAQQSAIEAIVDEEKQAFLVLQVGGDHAGERTALVGPTST